MSADDHNREMMVETIILNRDGEPVPLNPPPGPKWKALQGMMGLGLKGADIRVLWVLIEHANTKTGLCYPAQERIAALLANPERTVRRAISSLSKGGLIRVLIRRTKRGAISNAYIINWRPLFDAFDAMQKVAATYRPKVAARHRPKVAAEPSKDKPSKKNLEHEVVHRPSADRTVLDLSFKKEGEEVALKPPSKLRGPGAFSGERVRLSSSSPVAKRKRDDRTRELDRKRQARKRNRDRGGVGNVTLRNCNYRKLLKALEYVDHLDELGSRSIAHNASKAFLIFYIGCFESPDRTGVTA
jgi:hypothetical protein